MCYIYFEGLSKNSQVFILWYKTHPKYLKNMLKMQSKNINNFNPLNGDSSFLIKNKKSFQWRSEWLKLFWMLIPRISKAKTNCFGIRSAGTVDYRHGAKVRPNKLVLNGIGNEVSKKKSIKCSEAEESLVVR